MGLKEPVENKLSLDREMPRPTWRDCFMDLLTLETTDVKTTFFPHSKRCTYPLASGARSLLHLWCSEALLDQLTDLPLHKKNGSYTATSSGLNAQHLPRCYR